MKKILVLILIIISLISIYQFAYAYEVEGYNFGEVYRSVQVGNDHYIYLYDGEFGYIITAESTGDRIVLTSYNNITNEIEVTGRGKSIGYRKVYVQKVDITNGTLISTTIIEDQDTYTINVDHIIASGFDLTYNTITHYAANHTKIFEYKNNDKITVTNLSDTIMKSTLKGKLSSNTTGFITYVITDANGKFEKQVDKDTTILDLEILNIYPGETKNIYIQFPGDTLRTKSVTFNLFENLLMDFKTYIPRFEIIGQNFYEINTMELTTDTPFIQPMFDTLVLIKDGNEIYPQIIRQNEKFGIQRGKNLIFQFQHPSNSSLIVESNINITSSDIGFNPLNPEILESYVEEVYGGGPIPTVSTQDKIVNTTPNTAVKITRLGDDIISKSLEVYTTASSETNGKVEWFSEVAGQYRKIRDRAITSSFAGMKKQVLIMQGEYVVFSNNTGNIQITIPAMWKDTIDYTVEYIDNYETDINLETEYRANNPTMPDITTTNDIYTRTVDNSMYDWIQGNTPTNGDLTIPTISNIGQQITSFTDMFIGPVKTLFTSIPELYSLIIFGFGLAIVMFVLGR